MTEHNMDSWRAAIAQDLILRLEPTIGLRAALEQGLVPILVALNEELRGFNATPTSDERQQLAEHGEPIVGFPKLSHVVRCLREGRPVFIYREP